MSNVLKIEGSRTEITNPNKGYDLDLKALYQDTKYDFSRVTGGSQAMILHFSREGNLLVPDGLNVVILITAGNGHYRATGLTKYGRGDGKPQCYTMGDDLEIRVEPTADQAIKELPGRLR